ncbi:plasmid replication protein, CyRepA1 family [Leptolyngbya sp. AN02str]|uniref:plasmid replication protein, CyRepA1 family n=1 Tax=Leptolyngbya sp. AN02str TaxID=3423363 RepID=UPI003D31C041
MTRLASPLISSSQQLDFTQNIEHEFIKGSRIALALYQTATRVVSDTEPLPGGDVAYPIHEALNWKVTRFGYQARTNLYAILLVNEDGFCWQAKLSHPRQDARKGKIQKYETPVGNGARAYLPVIPPEIRQLISRRYCVDIPLSGSFWDWLEAHPEIPMVPTEGGKKALALLSQGFVPLALYGVNGGYQKLLDGTRRLIPDVDRFAADSRQFVLAFDQDEKESTRRRVSVALYRFGSLLQQAGCPVSVATWKAAQGKGVDDLIVQGGAGVWEQAYTQALSLQHWMIWQRLEYRLTYPAAVKVITTDLSTLILEDIPNSGIIAIESAKGTGKTKQIHALVKGAEKVIAGGHRIALMRNLSSRLGLDYKGDLDKVNGEFISGAGYTLRVGLCVDSLLSIEPSRFSGCDLILDEVVQVIRHLLTSSTCARDGKRPALLSRLRELIQVARRIIVADADLDNATLHYLKELRGDVAPIFLIRNAYRSEGYPVRFIQSLDRSVITGELLADLEKLPVGQVVFVATDSKGASKAIARLVAKAAPEKRVLLINSETSGGECEREFIQAPDPVLQRGEYDIIICSPSVATGVSIEAQGIIQKVYGIFTGTSSTDAGMAQALGRVRESVDRVVWCAQRGSNFSKVSRSTHALELKDHLQQRATATIRLIRSSLKEDVTREINRYDWQSDPHMNLFCRITAEQNFAMLNLRDALLVRLQFEGNSVTVENRESNPAIRDLLLTARQEQQEVDAQAILSAEDLMYSELLMLEQKEGLGREESLAVAKFYLKDFYCLDSLTLEDVLWDNEGRRRGELLNLEVQLFPGVAVDRTARALEKQATWNQGYCPWDISGSELRRWLRSKIGLDELIAKLRNGWQWCKYELKPYADRARELALQIKVALHYSITDVMSDTQIVHQLLSQLGIKLTMRWSRSHPGYEGEKLRVYSLDAAHWKRMWPILQRRQAKREALQRQRFEIEHGAGSPAAFEIDSYTGDPTPPSPTDLDPWSTPGVVQDVMGWIKASGYNPAVIAEIEKMIPGTVFQKLKLIPKASNL